MTSMSYAKYLYTSHYQVDVAEGDHVDHINGDKMDDRIENLQVISGTYNRQKDHKRKEMVVLVCPVCNEEFLFPKGNLSTHPNPCCSRKCGGIKSHWKQWLKGSRFKPWLAHFLGFLNRCWGLTGQCMLIQYNQQFRLRKENKEQLFLCVKGMPWNPPVAVRRVRGSKRWGVSCLQKKRHKPSRYSHLACEVVTLPVKVRRYGIISHERSSGGLSGRFYGHYAEVLLGGWFHRGLVCNF